MIIDVTLVPVQQRLLAVTIALVPLSVIIWSIYSFAAAQIAHHAHVQLLVRELGRYETLQREQSDWQAKLTALRSSPLWQGLFLADTGGRGASSPTQNRLAQIVTGAGGTVLQSSVNANGVSTGGATEIDERVTFTADITTFTHILADLRRPEPLFVVRRVSIQDQEAPLTVPRTVPNRLHIELNATGFGWPS